MTAPNLKAYREYLRDQSTVETLLEAVESLIVTLTGEAIIDDCNLTCERIGGYPIHELKGRSFASAFLAPEEAETVLDRLGEVAQGKPAGKFDSYLLTRQSQRRRIRWSCMNLGSEDAGSLLFLTGIDVTEEHDMRTQLREERRTVSKLERRLAVLSDTGTPGDVRSDRRMERRRPYAQQQLVAPVIGDRLPPLSAFAPIECYNIGAQGLAFLVERVPTFERLVVALSAEETTIHLMANVRHVTRAVDSSPRKYLVGCQFSGRVEID